MWRAINTDPVATERRSFPKPNGTAVRNTCDGQLRARATTTQAQLGIGLGSKRSSLAPGWIVVR